MTLFTAFRRPATTRPRAVVSLLAALWFGVILQPCAMAFGGEPQADCPHCPPAADTGHAAHERHGQDDRHGDDASPGHCAGTPADDCFVLGDDSVDVRVAKSKVKDQPLDTPLAWLPAPSLKMVAADGRQRQQRRTRLPGTPPPASLLFCVQLK